MKFLRPMRKIACILSFLILSLAVRAQTAEEILQRVDQIMTEGEKQGISMTVETKVPVLGKMNMKTLTLGDKMRMETRIMGVDFITWSDGDTDWSYDSKSKEVTIEAGSPSSAEESGDAEMFENITDGYDVSIKKETADAWYINCRKSKSNTNKDDPQKMELVVRKGTFHPVSLSTKISGVTLTMKDLRFGVSETEVTFDIKQYPGAKIVDKREKNLP